MTKTELLEALLVERHLPLPPKPQEPAPVYDDSEAVVKARCDALVKAVEASEKNARRHSKRAKATGQWVPAATPARDPDAAPPLVLRKGIWVADRSAA